MTIYNKEAAVGIIIRKESGIKILFIKRKEREGDPWSGDIGLPGGLRRDNETLINTVIRETKEEIGIDLTKHKLLFELIYFKPSSKKLPLIYIKPFVFLLNQDEKIIINKDEIEDAFWIDIYNLNKKKVKIKKINRYRNAFVYQNKIIWGLTYRIISYFMRYYLKRL